jgi:predicted PurR-regulated permease PerM
MARVLVLSLTFLFVFTIPALAELTASDLEKIQSIVQKSEMRLKKELKGDIAQLKAELKEDIQQEIATVNARIDGVHTRIDGIDKRLDNQFNLILSFIVLIAVAVLTPFLTAIYRARKAPTADSRESVSDEQGEDVA